MECVVLLSVLCLVPLSLARTTATVYYLEQDEKVQVESHFTNKLNIFCHLGRPKYIIHVWRSVVLKINHRNQDYTRYDGSSPEEIERKYTDKHYSWSMNIFTKDKNMKLNPFNDTCIGIESRHAYDVGLSVIPIDVWKLLFLVSGLLLFLSAQRLSSNTLFYYACGILFGVSASFLILIYYFSKLIPRKPFMYGVLGCGWTVVLYVLQVLWDNLRTILTLYREYVFAYIFVTGLISFILCYRWGPVENERTKNLIKWSFQSMGLLLIFFSSHFQEAAMGQIVILTLFYNLPKTWLGMPKRYWIRKFPPKQRLLDNDEYYEQGVRETRKALDELREFCSSPQCNQWQMALKLQNVKRFASFMEGNSHLSDNEILEYETSIQDAALTDEEDEFTEEED